MGSLLTTCNSCDHRRERKITLLMIGLDNAGKTCTTKQLAGEPVEDVVPTVGFSNKLLRHGRYNVAVYDLGGGRRIRGIWPSYYAEAHGIVFVVDACSDSDMIDECRQTIHEVLADPRVAGKPMLLLVNKQDLEGAMDEAEVCSLLDLEALVNERRCPTRVEVSSAATKRNGKTDPGIATGYRWLVGRVHEHFAELDDRVRQDVQEQKDREEAERAKRLERVQKLREERERQEMLGQNGTVNNGCQEEDSGNPFKPLQEVKEQLERNEAASRLQASLPNEVLHESGVSSPLSREDAPASSPQGGSPEQSTPSSEMENRVGSGSVSSQGEKKRRRKRFRNKVAPGGIESTVSPPKSPRLPPLRDHNTKQDLQLKPHLDPIESPAWNAATERRSLQERQKRLELSRFNLADAPVPVDDIT